VGISLDRGWRACVDPAWLDGWTPQDFDLGDGATEVVAMGDGPPLLLIPPLPGFKEAWLAVAAPLARAFRVVTFDLRCRFPSRPSWDALIADLERVLDAYAPGPAFVAGHSMGGALAQQWALARPERVRALVLSSSFTRVRNPAGNVYARFIEQPLVVASQRMLPAGPARALARTLARHGRWVYDARCDDRLLDFIRHCMRHTRYDAVRTALDLVMRHDTTARVAHIQAPTLLLVGELESVFSRPASDELARLIPNARLEESPRASHLHPLSSPEWFVRTVSDWLDTV
jgi:pimeloyl-ACP methyl ester carboxylesterase